MAVNKSTLFTIFNKARARRAGLDRGRVNRALGLIQSGKIKLLADGSAAGGCNGTTYLVTSQGCTCPDATYRGIWCKHRVARGILVRMNELQPAPAPAASDAVLEDEIALLWGAA
jgi:hypothetical protein